MSPVNTANRGKQLEQIIEAANIQYALKGLAQIDKVPTPMSPKSRNGQIISTKYTKKSTVDFVGTLKGGRAITFDTKQCAQKSLPLANIKEHQIQYLTRIDDLGGLAFILVWFTKENEMYILSINELNTLMRELDRKSIPLQWFRDNKQIVETGNGVARDYLNGLI